MDYGELLSTSWRITWRHKYLWLLGFFAAEGGGCNFSGSGWNVSGSDLPDVGWFGADGSPWQSGGEFIEGIVEFIVGHWVLLATLLGLALLAGLALLVIGVIATGGLVAGTADAHAARADASLRSAWRQGLASFWRIVGMWLLAGIGVLFAMAVLIVVLAIPVVLLFRDSAGFSWLHVALIVGAFLAFIGLVIPLAIGLQILLSWALRSLVLDGTGVIASLRQGWRLLRRRLGTSILIWIIATGIGIALGIAIAAIFVAAAFPLGLLLVPSLIDGHIGPFGLLAVLGPIALIVLALMLLVKAIMSTFFGAYWTVAYRQLQAEITASAVEPTLPAKPPE